MWCESTQKHIPEIINHISLVLNEPIHIPHLVYNQAAQFYVHRDLIRRHSKEAYVTMYDFLMDTTIPDWLSSRGFEYTWHYIFTGDHHDYSNPN